MARIDAHQHFWEINDTEYAWLDEDRRAIRRDYLPHDLEPLLRANKIVGCIAVHARQMVKETPWLLGLAERYNWIRAVVGWAPLLVNAGEPYLEEFADHPKLVGVRHVLQEGHNGQGTDYIHSNRFSDGIRRLEKYGLVFDLLVHGERVSQVIDFVDRHPNQVFVVDHVGKPRISVREFDEEWRAGIVSLARRVNVYCKVSGMLTEVQDPDWNVETLRPTFETVLESFGPSRLMYGSDWPVCLLRASYESWVHALAELVGSLSSSEKLGFWGENAIRVYGLDCHVSEPAGSSASAASTT